MKNNENKNSIIEEAAIELQSIVEAANKSAKDKMAEQLPEQFEKLLKEELNKNKKESVQESDKDVTKEPVIEGKKTDNNKESLNEMEEIDLRELSINDIEEAYNEANTSDEFEVSSDDIELNDVEKELGQMEGMAAEVDTTMQEEGENDPFGNKLKNLHKMLGEMIQDNEQPTNEMHNPGTDSENINDMHKGDLGSQTIDEDMTSPDIIAGVVSLLSIAGSTAIPAIMGKLKQSNPKLAAALENLGSGAAAGINNTNPSGFGESVKNEEEKVIDEVETVEDDKETVDEIHGQSHSAGKVSTGRLPNDGAEYRDRKGHSRNRPQWSNESVEKFKSQKENMEKRMTSLISENKKMTKKLNENKSELKKFESLSSDQKNLQEALVKYRDQLSEMAVFNTNLASVNNILVNESLALTIEDKKELINKFKNVKTIDESEKTYKSVLSEMKTAKKSTITESIEEKVNDTIESSAQKTEKIVEQTAFKNEHVDKIKSLMEYVDNHGNSRIL